RERPFMVAEKRHDRGVDVKVHDRVRFALQSVEWKQTLCGDHLFEIPDCSIIEPGEVAIDRVQARDVSTREVDEQRIGGERLHGKRSVLAHCEDVHQQPELAAHRVDHLFARLQPAELLGQLRVDSERAEEPTKGHQAPYARHALVGGTWPHAARVRTSHTSSLFLEAMPLSPLASRPITTHLLGASRASSSVFFHTPQMRTRSPSFKGLSATSERLGSASSERDGAKSRIKRRAESDSRSSPTTCPDTVSLS